MTKNAYCNCASTVRSQIVAVLFKSPFVYGFVRLSNMQNERYRILNIKELYVVHCGYEPGGREFEFLRAHHQY